MNEQIDNKKSVKKKKLICILSITAAVILVIALFFNSILNFFVDKIMGKDLPQLTGEPEIGKWYAVDIDDAVSSDGSKWQGYFRKGSENKVVLYFYGGGFSVNDYTAARSMDIEGGFYNPRLNSGLNVMTYAIKEWGIGNSATDNAFKDWTFIGVPYCNGDFHTGTSEKEYTALDGSTKTIHYVGYNNYRKLVTKLFNYIDESPEQLLVTGSSAGGFGTALNRHQSGDWGELCEEDREVNEDALENGFRIMSVYTSKNGTKFWVITEADRSCTTVLMPEDY